jgi:uncharacterized protein (DUF885 family)
MSQLRIPTPIDAIAERHLESAAALDPSAATLWGVAGHDDELPLLSPDWHAAVSSLRTDTLRALSAAEPVDVTDRVTAAALREALELAEQLRAAGADESALNNLASPVQGLRDVFDLTPTDTVEQWATVARRLSAVPASIAGYTASLRRAAGATR